MFYEGDLQSGIAKAIQEARLLACFLTGSMKSPADTSFDRSYLLTGDDQESRRWENEYLRKAEVITLPSICKT